MKISEEIIEKIKEQNDIVDVVAETVRLKKAGRNFWGLCPFHNEKTPSFSVSQDKQIFKCFGCGEAGNVISFVMKVKNVSFMEAVKYLADRANITLNFENNKPTAMQRKKDMIYKVNVEAARYYYSNLQKNPLEKEYFLRRGITESTITKFGLGYSKDGWRNTLNYLRQKGFNEELIQEAGLVIKSDKGTIYDRFRNRVIFPVFDYKGKVIGFGGRVLDDSKPKYLNSPDTLVFQKGVNLYALNFVLKEGLKEREIIMVEGYMDCISLHQYGIKNVVASLGTALTENQARLLKRYVDKVIISYDADLAGQKATLRGLDVLIGAGIEVRILTIPKGKDPDEFVRANGKEAFLKLIEGADELIEYKLKKAKDGLNLSDGNQLVKYANRITNILSSINPVEKDIYIKKISEQTGIREQALYDLLNKKMKIFNKNERNMNNKEEYGTKLYVEPTYVKSERSLLKLMSKEESYFAIKKDLKEEDFILKEHKEIYKLLDDTITQFGFQDIIKKMELQCSEDPKLLKEWIDIIESKILDIEDNTDVLVKDYIYHFKKYKLETEKKNIISKMKTCEKQNNIKESLELVKKAKEITERLNQLERSK